MPSKWMLHFTSVLLSTPHSDRIGLELKSAHAGSSADMIGKPSFAQYRSRSAATERSAGRTDAEFIDGAQSNSPAPPSVEVAPTHSANSALHDITPPGHHSTAHHSTTHHSAAHHSAAHHSATREEFAHSAHLHPLRVITVVDD